MKHIPRAAITALSTQAVKYLPNIVIGTLMLGTAAVVTVLGIGTITRTISLNASVTSAVGIILVVAAVFALLGRLPKPD